MWPKRKKKGRGSKAQLKTVKLGKDADELDVDLESEADAPVAEQENRPEDLFSGVWKSKVLQTYKKNPRDSHTLLAKVPTQTAGYEAGEREKGDLIRESMIDIIDKMFDNFQNTAYEFNQVTGGSDLELSWVRPILTRERVSEWHSNKLETTDLFSGRISTRYWTLVVRGTVNGIAAFILPADKMLAFNSDPGDFSTYLRMVPSSDGFRVVWQINRRDIDFDLMPSVYRALLDGLVRFANEEASGDDAFMLSDIGIVQDAPPPAAPQPSFLQDDGSMHLLGQHGASQEEQPAAPIGGVINKLSSQVANQAQVEAERMRESMKESTSNVVSRALSSEFSTSPSDFDSPGIFDNDPQPFQGTAAAKMTGEWKTLSTAVPAASSDWRKFMAANQSANNNVSSGVRQANTSSGVRPANASSSQEAGWQPVASQTNLPAGGSQGLERQSRQFSSQNVISQQVSSQPSPPVSQPAPMPQAAPVQEQPAPVQPQPAPSPQVQLQPPQAPPPPGVLETVDRDSFTLSHLPPGSLQGSSSAPRTQQNPQFNNQAMPLFPQPTAPSGFNQGQVPPQQMAPQANPYQQQQQAQPQPLPQPLPLPLPLPPPQQPQPLPLPLPVPQPVPLPLPPPQPQPVPQPLPLPLPPPQQQVPPSYSQPGYPQQGGYPLGFPPAPPQSYPPGFQQGYPQGIPGQQVPPGFPGMPGAAHGAPQGQYPQQPQQNNGTPRDFFEQTGQNEDHFQGPVVDAQSSQYQEPYIEDDGQAYDEEEMSQAPYEYDDQTSGGFPGDSHVGLPAQTIPQAVPQAVVSAASYAELGTALPDDVRLAADPDLADALTVLLSTIDKQIEALTRQGGEAFSRRDFRQAESIVRLSERLTNFKLEANLLLDSIEPSSD